MATTLRTLESFGEFWRTLENFGEQGEARLQRPSRVLGGLGGDLKPRIGGGNHRCGSTRSLQSALHGTPTPSTIYNGDSTSSPPFVT
jgi:hypothetical protein